MIGYPPNNAPSSCCYLSKVLLQKRSLGYAKVIHKKRVLKKKKKMDAKVSEISKTMGTQMPSWKKEKEMNKIAHVFLQNCFQVQKVRYDFKEHSRIRIATIYIHTHAHLDLIVWLNSLWIWGLTLQYMYCEYALYFLPTYELHISLSCTKRKA